jgi:5-formyl-3-hydroxy-2-methylpyridine 4-carboxylic acid 5-dehydrogenase
MTAAAVIGLGTMGPGIAATLARGGMTVRAFDANPAAMTASSALIEAAQGVLEALEVPDRAGGAVSLTDDLAACVQGADLVIETIPEDLALKRALFARLDELVSEGCVLASDTSGLPITKLQQGTAHPGRVVGMHWSNPPHIIPIVEVIAGAETTPAVVDWMARTIEEIHLLPVRVKKDVPGFVENRVLYALLRECVDLVETGVIDPESLDTCVSWGIGYKLAVVGPMALLDMAGLDIYQAVGSYLNQELCRREDVSPFVTRRTAENRLGIKTGGGIFDYSVEHIQALRRARSDKLVAVRKALKGS